MGGGPRGGNVISTEGNAKALHSGLGPVLGFSLFLYFRHPSISDEKNCRAGGNNSRAATVKSGSTVFRVPQQQRAVSAAKEFCVQIHAIKLAVKPQQK